MVRRIIVVPHDPLWLILFRQEADWLSSLFGDLIIAIHHFGSTSIPAIFAKPIVDILVEVRDIEAVDVANELMVKHGYIPKGEFGIPGRRFFIKGSEDNRTHHVHFYLAGHPEVKRHLDFRDFIFAHPEEAEKYSQLKIELAQMFPEDIDGYNIGKTNFIKEIDRQAKVWNSNGREQCVPKEELIQRMEIAALALLKLVSRIPKDQLEQRVIFGEWSIKDIFSHINYWQALLLHQITAVRGNETVPQSGNDLDDINARVVETYLSRTWQETAQEFENQLKEMIQIVRDLSQSDLCTAGRFWAIDHEPLWRSIAEETYEHYAEHLDHIQAWWRKAQSQVGRGESVLLPGQNSLP